MELSFEDGKFLAYRLFEVSDEIDLGRAAQQLGVPFTDPRPRMGPLVYALPTLTLALGERELSLGAGPDAARPAQLAARIFPYGAISICFELRIDPALPIGRLTELADLVYESEELTTRGRQEVIALLPRLGPALTGAHPWAGFETYTVLLARAVHGAPSREALLECPDLPRLLLGESSGRALSEQAAADVTKNPLSYYQDDLAVIDWNSALVIDPGLSREIPELLELATSQLLELRYYDDILDQEIGRAYASFEGLRAPSLLATFWSPYTGLAREMLRRFIELSEFTERVDNAVKVVGDLYLARVYRAAVDQFQIRVWQATVDQKLSLVAQVYSMFKDELNHRRTLLLEIIVVLLIGAEILMVVLGNR